MLEQYFKLLQNAELISGEVEAARSQVNNILNKWKKILEYAERDGRKVVWRKETGGEAALLIDYGKALEDGEEGYVPIEMMTSMRNVDTSASLKIATKNLEVTVGTN